MSPLQLGPVGAPAIASVPRWTDYRIDPVVVHPDDLADVAAPGLVREAARAAADDPAATLGGPARAVSVRPAPRPTRSRSTR